MALTLTQKMALKNAIISTPVLNAYPNTMDGAYDMAAQQLNLIAVPLFKVWNTKAPVDDIFDAINWSIYTPVDTPDNSTTYGNRVLNIQTKQMNLQNMLIGKTEVNAAKANMRAGLRDAVILIPAGVNGAMVNPGGVSGTNVLSACTRDARLIEKILTTGPATTGAVTADVMGYEGAISAYDVMDARNS
jgi:hypothetical protein